MLSADTRPGGEFELTGRMQPASQHPQHLAYRHEERKQLCELKEIVTPTASCKMTGNGYCAAAGWQQGLLVLSLVRFVAEVVAGPWIRVDVTAGQEKVAAARAEGPHLGAPGDM